MFDKNYSVDSKVVAVTKETVVEKAISPDKVTDMYDKVRAQVERDIVMTIKVENNSINGVVVQVAHSADTYQTIVHTGFTLNGEEFLFKQEIPLKQIKSSADLYEILLKNYSQTIANRLANQIIHTVVNHGVTEGVIRLDTAK